MSQTAQKSLGSANLRGCSQLLHEVVEWGTTLCGNRAEDHFPLGYHVKRLHSPSKFLPQDWCTLQTALSRSMVSRDKYKIIIFLCTLTYFQHTRQELVQTLLAFATVPRLRAIRPPDYASFQLSDGFSPNKNTLSDLTRKRVRPFELCPESMQPDLLYENWVEADGRRN